MGFMDENAGGGGPPILKFNNEGKYVKRGSEEAFNDQHFVAYPRDARAGYIKFGAKGEAPERRFGAIFPKDEAPPRASLGDTDKSGWPDGKFSGEPEDPWTPVIEIPLRHQETGEEYLLTCQSKTSIGAAKDLFAQLRRVPDGHDPVIKLGVGTMQTRYGKRKKPVLSLSARYSTRMVRQRRLRQRTRRRTTSLTSTTSPAFEICGVDLLLSTPCRCGCTRIRVHPHSTKSNIPIWKCAWCDDRKGKLTETEIKTLEGYVRLFGWPVLPLTFNDDGCVYAYGELSQMRKAPARVGWKDGGVSTVSTDNATNNNVWVSGKGERAMAGSRGDTTIEERG